MVHNKENLLKLGKKMTDRIPQKLGLVTLTEKDPEFWGMVNVLDDEMVDIALKMKQRTPYSLKELSELTGIPEDPLYEKLQKMAETGLLEYNWGDKLIKEHSRETKRYVLPLFVPGSAELFNMNRQVSTDHPEVTDFFERMTYLPLEHVTSCLQAARASVCTRSRLRRPFPPNPNLSTLSTSPTG